MKKRDLEKRIAAKQSESPAHLGLKAGLEIHQRLDTKKLFCSCDSHQKIDPFIDVERRLRAVPGELGEVDPAALYEYMKDKRFVYRASPAESCLVELDEEPPHGLRKESLAIALQIAKMLNCNIPEEIHVMRKTVIDGSNTGGFQRTAIIGLDGELKMPWGPVPINSVAIEEESARIETRSEGKAVYWLSGLGIPLVEITTGIIEDSDRVREVAEKIGLLLRSTKVQRGIGSIRQDINVSIPGGTRIEIKGFQELAKVDNAVRNEAKRQADLLKLRDELIKRKSHRAFSSQDVTEIFKATKNNLLRKIVAEGGRIIAVLLPEFGGLLKWECGDRTLGKELAGYAMAYGMGGMIHTDEDMPKYGIMEEMEKVKQLFAIHEKQAARKSHAETQDAISLLAWKAPAVNQAAQAIIERAKQCEHVIPEETRIADGTGTKHARPLPGKARMYPETDIPPIPISDEFLDSIELPKTLEERGKAIEKLLPKQMAEQLIHSPYLSLFETLSKEHDPMLVGSTLLYTLIEIRRKGFDIDKLHEEDFRALFDLVKRSKIPKDVLADAIILRLQGKSISEIDSAFSEMPEPELRSIVKAIIKKAPGQNEGALMGLIMKEVRGRASGSRVARILREEKK